MMKIAKRIDYSDQLKTYRGIIKNIKKYGGLYFSSELFSTWRSLQYNTMYGVSIVMGILQSQLQIKDQDSLLVG